VQIATLGTVRSATDPRKLTASDHPRLPGGGARVLGLERSGDGIAYPIGLLDRVEVINDREGHGSTGTSTGFGG
jgi:hypothetical protein